MKHVLDNPVWNALTSGNKVLAEGNEKAKYFEPEVAPFAGLNENTHANFTSLYDIIPFNTPIAIFTNDKNLKADPWQVDHYISGYQLLYKQALNREPNSLDLVALNESHVPEMLALARLTNPGPFASKTINLGNYRGIFFENKLVAMAGLRLHNDGFSEISAVCTHPEYLGRGYARALIFNQIHHIQQQGETAYLHVRSDNIRAIEIYQSMGFEIRSEMTIYVLKK
jgi:ribosomal protein S18 acetylase RimI-like enzyme